MRNTLCCALIAASAALPATAQAPLSREFERAFFARREAWIDRLFTAARPERRKAAVALLAAAMSNRGYADSRAGDRSHRLARAAAALVGLDPDDATFQARFNWFLLALPEVVDPRKLGKDRVTLGEITRRMYPLLRPVTVDDPDAPAKDADKIFLTARGVFGADKPAKLRVGFMVRRGGKVVAQAERGDSDDPQGWLLYDLEHDFSCQGQEPGRMRASAHIGFDGTWPRRVDPPLLTRFWLAPGYYHKVWELLGLRRRLAGGGAKQGDRILHDARLHLLTREVMRPLLGHEYLHRSWPVRALTEATELAKQLEDGAAPALTETGDLLCGIPAQDAENLDATALRLVWGKKSAVRRAWIVLAPSGHDENYVVDGLGIAPRELQRDASSVFVMTTFPVTQHYFGAVQDMLAKDFGVGPEATRLVGILDGATRASYAWQALRGPLRELVLIGRETADVRMLRSDTLRGVHVVPAYGKPTAGSTKVTEKLIVQLKADPARIRLEPVGPRSLAEAWRLAVR